MSIYTYLIELEKLTFNSFTKPPMPGIVAYKNDGKSYLYAKDDFLEKLNKLPKDYIIDSYYWNYKYHKFDMLSENTKNFFREKIDIVVENLDLAAYGYFLNKIIFHEILVNIYRLDKKDLVLYLEKINMSKSILLNFLIEHNYNLPFCENYYIFLKRILDDSNSFKILDIIFNPNSEKVNLDSKNIKILLENFDYGDINDAYLKITQHKNYDLEKRLKYLKILIESYNSTIDQEDIIYLSIQKGKKILGFYLFELDIIGRLTNLYYSVLKSFLDKGGVKKIIIVDDAILNDKINNRLLSYY